MKRRGAVVLVLVVGVLGLVAALVGRYAMPGPIYTTAEVKGALQRQPEQWAGRTVLVRGVVTGSAALNMCTSTNVASSNLCAQTQSWTIAPAGAARWTRWSSPAFLTRRARLLALLGANGGVAPAGLAANHLYVYSARGHAVSSPPRRVRGGRLPLARAGQTISIFVYSTQPARELVVADPHGAFLPTQPAQRTLPDAAYTLPVVGPLVARFFPHDGSGVYRVRLLDPRICAQVTQPPCADAVFAR